MNVVRTAHPEEPALDMALTESLLREVARGSTGELVRVFRPGPTVAFGRSDRLRPGFEAAGQAARRHGRVPVLRLGGGNAAAYDQDCVLVEIIRREARTSIGGFDPRFAAMVDLLESALARLDISVEQGELAGEYCPGRYSLHLPGGPKVAGVAQRVITGASLTTAVLVIAGGSDLRLTLTDVYRALELDVDVATAGAITDHHPDVSAPAVEQALLDEIAARGIA